MSRLNKRNEVCVPNLCGIDVCKAVLAGCWLVLAIGAAFPGSQAHADETLYRYEGDVLPQDPSAGWVILDPCEAPCSESLQDGHFVLFWPEAADFANYRLLFGSEPDVPPPPTLWVEWRFRSNDLLESSPFVGCDADFVVDYKEIVDLVVMTGDTAVSFDGGSFVTGLDIDAFHTYRFESLDGTNYTFAVDGQVFLVRQDVGGNASHLLQMHGRGGCAGDDTPNQMNEWDFVRYGTIGFGERVISADPPSGLLDPVQHADLDRFAITFNAANFAYLDDITVDVTSGVAPVITQTWRRENDEPDTMEIVLDDPLDTNAITRFIISDGVSTSVIEYTYGAGDFGACCQIDGFCTSQTETGCDLIPDAAFLGIRTECTTNACDLGPCCFSDGGCAEEFREACLAIAGAEFHTSGFCQGDDNGNGIDEFCEVRIPTTSQWGLLALTLALLIVGTQIIQRRTTQDM